MYACRLYKMIHPATRPQYSWLHAHTNLPTKAVSMCMDGVTGAVLDELKISTYIDFNGMDS